MKITMTTALATMLLAACTTVPVHAIPVAMREPPADVQPDATLYLETAEPYYFEMPKPGIGGRCPPLPLLKEGATRLENRIWTLTIIGLYAQCASKP